MKPFLKWAGNKYKILDRILQVLPDGQRLIEPFVGSGAIFLNTNYPAYLLCDNNADLINLYTHLKKEGQAFIEYAATLFVPENNRAERFYALRERFNTTVEAREKAALFIYLNKHCYNGLCRYNRKGRFNTPFGRYKKPYFPAMEMHRFHARLQRAELVNGDFHNVMERARPGDVVYCDPPYVPLSATANFTSYSPEAFGPLQQELLALKAEELSAKGVHVVISNHDTPYTREVYAQAKITNFGVRRSISRNANRRQMAPELLAVF